jgi:hypothetical protein
VENGYETRLGRYKVVRAPAGTLAHMASAVGITPGRLEEAGRSDAAAVLREIQSRRERAMPPLPDIVREHWDDPAVRDIWALPKLPAETRGGLVRLYLDSLKDEGANGGVAERT